MAWEHDTEALIASVLVVIVEKISRIKRALFKSNRKNLCLSIFTSAQCLSATSIRRLDRTVDHIPRIIVPSPIMGHEKRSVSPVHIDTADIVDRLGGVWVNVFVPGRDT